MERIPYSTRTEAIQCEIIDAIESGGIVTADEYDIEAIAHDVLGGYEQDYVLIVSLQEFWASVESHQIFR